MNVQSTLGLDEVSNKYQSEIILFVSAAHSRKKNVK